jgi:mycofactocin glycosyltransferase
VADVSGDLHDSAKARRLGVDPSYRRPGAGRVIVGGSPLRVFRLSEGGRRVADALERGAPLPIGHEKLTDRLIEAGAVHPTAGPPLDPAELTVVIPAFRECPAHVPTACRCIVVDDGSPTPLSGLHDMTVIRLDHNAGPGAARNAGLAMVETPFVAFVDSDVTIGDDHLLQLAGHLRDPRVALVAPRVRSVGASGVLDRYENDHSPLDLGASPARIAATTRVSYVPAAVIVCRREALVEIGGFDPRLRYGEDVDLEWRLAAAGWGCRYEPAVEAMHRTRPTLSSWLAQRFRYGTSAAPLAIRHPGAVAPLRISPWSAATWIPIIAGLPVLGALVGITSAVLLVRKLPFLPASESLRLAGLGNLFAGRLVAAAVTRSWWPLAAVAALISRRARRVVIAAIVIPALLDRRDRGHALDPVRELALRMLDDVAYGTGVWVGAARHRSLGAITPVLTAWPPRDP